VYQVHYVITDLRLQIRKDLQFQLIGSLLGHLKTVPQLRWFVQSNESGRKMLIIIM